MNKIALTLSLLLAAAPAYPQQKKRVAVFNFEYGTVQSGLYAIFGGNVDIGKGIADMIVDRLVNGGVYSVIERKSLDKILAEQNFSNSDRADASTAARLGRILGVDAIVIGSITQFGRDDKTTNYGGFGRVTDKYGIGGIGKRESKAVVGISARLVSTETAEVLASATGNGQSSRSGTALLGAGGSSTAAAGGNYDMRSSNFANTILGEATAKAVTDLSKQLEGNAARLPTVVVKIEGLVADVNGNSIILNIGSRAGIKIGDRLPVRRVTRTVTDPATGKVLRKITDIVGELTITEADESSAVGTFNGSGTPKVGDSVGQ